MPIHTVAEGEWIGSIAADAGFDSWDWIWALPQNASLRAARSEPNLLVPGDHVFVPPVEPKTSAHATDAAHEFVRAQAEDKLILRFNGVQLYIQHFGPLEYTLTVAGNSQSGKISSENEEIAMPLPIGTREATLEIGGESTTLNVGGLQPIARLSGMQARLNNQGFFAGPVDNLDGPKTQRGAIGFQEYNDLKVDGVIGSQTRGKMKSIYGC